MGRIKIAMSYVVPPFEVASRALRMPARVRFVHLLSGIATRHSDTIDCFFLVEGEKVTVAVSCAALTELRAKQGQALSDQQVAEIAALHLRRNLESGFDSRPTELPMGLEEIVAAGRELSYL